jgi:aminocarboxymuconate-semialdehyde decarboxylase
LRPRAVEEILRDLGPGGPGPMPYGTKAPPMTDSPDDLDRRLAIMDSGGVQVQVLSLVPLPTLGDEEVTVRLVRAANDALADVAARRPDRFRAYAELPLPYLDAALGELERCRDQLGLDAVNLLASCGDTSIVAREFDPLYEELDRHGSVMFIHPRVSGLCSALVNDYELAAPLGTLFEDTLVVAQMVRRQFLQKFSAVRVVVPHLGGILPIYLQRMDNQMQLFFPDLPERPSDTVRRIWFDTLVHGSVPALRSAWESFGVDRLVTGSDFPVMEHHDGYAANIDYIRHAGLPDADVEQILHVNAPRLFGLN